MKAYFELFAETSIEIVHDRAGGQLYGFASFRGISVEIAVNALFLLVFAAPTYSL